MSLSVKMVSKVRPDFYDADAASSMPSIDGMADIFSAIDSFVADYISKSHDPEVVRHLTVIRVSLNAMFAEYRSDAIFNFKSVTDHGLFIIQDFASCFFKKYGNRNISIDEKGFRTIFEPIMVAYLNHHGVLMRAIDAILGGEKDDPNTQITETRTHN